MDHHPIKYGLRENIESIKKSKNKTRKRFREVWDEERREQFKNKMGEIWREERRIQEEVIGIVDRIRANLEGMEKRGRREIENPFSIDGGMRNVR